MDLQTIIDITASVLLISAAFYAYKSKSISEKFAKTLTLLAIVFAIFALMRIFIVTSIVLRDRDFENMALMFDSLGTITISICALLSVLWIRQAINELESVGKSLEKMATTDVLTGIYNRRHSMDLTRKELERSTRGNTPIAVLLFDIDFFKKVNDKYGHAAGDEVLIMVAQVCKLELRNIDIFGRTGGEEFMITLPSTDTEGAIKTAERLRFAVEKQQVLAGRDIIRVTISLGVSFRLRLASHHNLEQAMETIIHEADTALYAAKRQGRNRAVVWNKSMN